MAFFLFVPSSLSWLYISSAKDTEEAWSWCVEVENRATNKGQNGFILLPIRRNHSIHEPQETHSNYKQNPPFVFPQYSSSFKSPIQNSNPIFPFLPKILLTFVYSKYPIPTRICSWNTTTTSIIFQTSSVACCNGVPTTTLSPSKG